jgi:hypothetical protein
MSPDINTLVFALTAPKIIKQCEAGEEIEKLKTSRESSAT